MYKIITALLVTAILAACGNDIVETEGLTYDEVQSDLEENQQELMVNDESFGKTLEMIEMKSTQAILLPVTNEENNNYELLFVAEFEVENTSPKYRKVPLDQAMVQTNNGGEAEVKTVGVSPLTTEMDGGQSAISTLRFDFPGISYSGADFVDITFPPIEDENGEVVSESYEYRINLVDETED